MGVLDEVKALQNQQAQVVDGTVISDPKPQNITVNMPAPKVPTIEERITHEVATTMQDQTAVALQDEVLKGKMRAAATNIVVKKVDTVVKDVTAENNEATSELEEEAIACFGYKPGKSIRWWQTAWAGYYHAALSGIWMFIAMFTFAPVVFIAKKVHTAAKVTWWGIVLGLLIYLSIVFIPVLVALVK